jgi:D-beta-D-heptose 7-phosphate kinase/D-beta-D-heptose 1-phosphate adenosyltransferase
VASRRASGDRVVFTNGCFDIIHPGHVTILEAAAGMGDLLVVGLNTDESVKRLKGPGRPVQPLESRAAVLSALRFVDCVVPFGEDTPLELITILEPDVLVKGGDYSPETVVGADIVTALGGEVRIVPLFPGHSTTGILKGNS